MEITTRAEINTSTRDSCGHSTEITDSCVITSSLILADTEHIVDVEPVAVELLSEEFVELESNLVKDVVEEIASPTDCATSECRTSGLNDLNLGNTATEIDVQEVVSVTVNVGRSISGSEGVVRDVADNDREEREPIALLESTNEVCDSARATILITFELTECADIDVENLNSLDRHFVIEK